MLRREAPEAEWEVWWSEYRKRLGGIPGYRRFPGKERFMDKVAESSFRLERDSRIKQLERQVKELEQLFKLQGETASLQQRKSESEIKRLREELARLRNAS